MPWTGVSPNQTVMRTDGTRTGDSTWTQAAEADVDILAADHDAHDQDLANMIASCLKKDGGNAATGNIPMGGFSFTNVGAATALNQYVTMKQRINGSGQFAVTVGGTANAVTMTTGFSLTDSDLGDGACFLFRVASTNTGPVTLAIDGCTALAIKRQDGTSLLQGDLHEGSIAEVRYDDDAGHLQLMSLAYTSASADIYARLIKAGSILAWPHETVPAGWLECDGSAISRTTYAELFSSIGTTYGVGNGTTTFNLPDFRGYFLRGFDSTATTDVDAASRTNRGDGTTGNSVGTKQADAYESHNHGGATGSGGAHSHTVDVSVRSDLAATGGSNAYRNGSNASLTTSTSDAHTHTIPASGGTETRPVNATVKWIILANPSAASAGTLGLEGLNYSWLAAASTIASGGLKPDSDTLASSTGITISKTDANGADLGGLLDSWDDSTSDMLGTLRIYKVGDPGTFVAYNIATATEAASSYTFTGTYVDHDGTFTAGDPLGVVFIRTGDKGDAASDFGVKFTFNAAAWSSGTPGTGYLQLDNTTYASATTVVVSFSCAEAGNPSVENWVKLWDDSTSTNKGQLLIRDLTDTSAYVLLNITSAATLGASWAQYSVSHIDSNGTISGNVGVQFVRTGDKGESGAGTGDMLGANNLSDLTDPATAFANIKQAATDAASGAVELATVAEAGTGTDTSRAVTPAGLFPAEADVASGATTNIGAATTTHVKITGTTTITAFDTVAAGLWRRIRFEGALTLTHNAAIILPGSTSITTAAGDTCTAVSFGSGVWRVYQYTKASGQPLVSASINAANLMTATPAFGMIGPINVGLAAAVSSSALVISLKGADGNNPSATNPVIVPFSNATLSTGTPIIVSVTGATSITVDDGAATGHVAGNPARLWVVAINNAGTVELAVINCLDHATRSLYGIAEEGLVSTTAVSDNADSAGVFYSTTAHTDVAYRVIGFLEWAASSRGTPGTGWATPTRIRLFTSGSHLPGAIVQSRRVESSAVATTTTTIPYDDTIPGSTGGGQFLTGSITPASAANILDVTAYAAQIGASVAGIATGALFFGAAATSASAAASVRIDTATTSPWPLHVNMRVLAGTSGSAISMPFRVGLGAAGTLTFNGVGAARKLGGVSMSYVECREIMA